MSAEDVSLVVRFPVTTIDGERLVVWHWRKEGHDYYRASERTNRKIILQIDKLTENTFRVHRGRSQLIAFKSAHDVTLDDV
jgi:hypothetical protein